ncbi:sugar transporter ERD6-like 15 isoform X2 [Durio zibethinus]|uniref:Sugar transporter ERD6-like 15 isoform X2 n=1 Tax=Durio zibethinus TaxID=66656 RepID=A0A6P5Z2Y5_DURZI|nr:sugar transporter ERD6-like 15 isoform X2 [Durio zibethinus]
MPSDHLHGLTSKLTDEQSMAEQRRAVTETLLLRSFLSNENNGALTAAASEVTTTLVLSAFVTACMAFGLGNLMGYSSPTQSGIMEDMDLSLKEFSLFGSTLTVGAMLGAAIGGKVTDLLGRKGTMWILNVLYIGGWFAIAFAKVPWLLDLGRLSLGSVSGITGFLMPLYIAEITPKDLRGRISAIVPLMVCWGLSFIYLVGSFVNWRTLALIATIPGLLQLPLLYFVPESPRWLAKVGREKEVEDVLLCLRGEKVDISEEATEIKDYTESLRSVSKGSTLDVFQRTYARPLLIMAGLMALQSLGGIGAFAFYSGAIIQSAGISSLIGLITLAAVQTLLGLLGVMLLDKAGRRPLLLVSFAGLCFGSFLTGLSFFLKDFNWWDDGTPILALIGLLMYMGSSVLGAGIPWLLIAEVFPVNVKGSAGSICNLINNVFAWVISYYFNFLIQWSSAAFCAANYILVAKFIPETKGKKLEEIQESVTHSLQ